MMRGPQFSVRVAGKFDLAPGICMLELVHPQGQPLPAFDPGAHVDVALPGGHVRQYSLCNAPSERHRYLLGILRQADGRGGSQAVHDSVHPGDMLSISEPKCHFALVDEASESVLLAGGIGITPILAMAEHLSAHGRAFSFDYFCRSAGAAAFLDRIAGAPWAAQARTHFDDQGGGDLAAIIGAAHAGKHLYVCGPTGFLDAALAAARRLGWSEAHLHREYFSNETAEDGGDAFDIQIASTGTIIRVASGQSITAALETVGITVPTSCEQGVCGTCVTRVLAGTPDHRDLFLTDEEHAANDCMTVCCSRSSSPLLVLDL